jgi:predicted transcriptional regulator
VKNRINLDLARPEESALVIRALSSPIRLKILQIITAVGPKNITELAEQLTLPLSTAALHVRVLEESGLILIQEKPGLRGYQKICAPLAEDVYLNLVHHQENGEKIREQTYGMPVGNYFECSVTKPCGIAGRRGHIGLEDSTNAFYNPNRTHAQLIWFAAGFLEYRFPIQANHLPNLHSVRFSFEACSETIGYNNEWPSDITIWINNAEVYTFRSAGDFGDKRGIYTPHWWPDVSTQYGELHTVEITRQGCFGDGRKCSELNVTTLGIANRPFISFKIGIKENAEYVGGLNIFGKYFGNYPQNIDILIRLEK